MRGKKTNKVYGIRISEEQREALQSIANATNTDVSFLIRQAINGLLDYVEANDGKVTLPLEFTTAFTDINKVIEEMDKKSRQEDS